MYSSAIFTLVKMLECLPEDAQNQVVEHLRDYIADLEDDLEWDASFKNTQSKLISAAKTANREIEQGKSIPMDFDR
ncbi:MAG: hypothetical protein A2W36_05645 [Chloroflexi bacterium RBG_16_58_14]|nr:MAG: hypothetical protein A2W36_05645 [Chloroflexi bacterium RBG_16_58_14]